MKYLQVAKWEFLEKIKSKAFLISLVMMPLIMVVFGILPSLLASKGDDRTITIGVIDETGVLVAPLSARLDQKYQLRDGQPIYVLRNLTEDGDAETQKQRANELVTGGEVEGYFSIPASVFDSGKVEYRSENVGNFRVTERFSRTLEEVITDRRARDLGYDPVEIRELMAEVDVRSIKVSASGAEEESGFLETFFSSYVFILMLMFLVMTSGQLLIRSVVEEKSNRVIEVLVSSCSARDLMIGKIVGLSGLGIVQVMLWALIGAGVAMKLNVNVFQADVLLISLVYFILGYLLYAGIFVAVGSPVTTEQEAQQLTTYVSLILVFPIVLAVPVIQNPNSSLVTVLSFIPLLTPAFMVMRMPIQMPPLWEILATVGLLVVSVVVVMWAAGKIFRTAILVYGKRPTPRELLRWLRAA
jgi:ABC-2 type transport system permease protein